MTNEERNLLSSDPYPGLRPYHEDEQDKFFGRDADAEVLIDKVLTNRLTLLFAASGVGKSSLLQAAVIPRLKSPTGENLEVVYHIDWVSEPVSSVRAAVLQALHSSGKLPEGAADEAGETLAELLEFCGLFVRHPLVLILDQFEEFFRYQRASASFQPFIEQLTAIITNPQLPVSLVLSMREDFALELNAFKPRLPTILFENFYRLEKLGRVGAREAIVTPVEQVGFRYEPVLLEILLDDLLSRELDRLPNSPAAELLETVEPPYLQIVCAQLWDLNRADPDKLLRLVTYEKAGKAKGILSNYLKGVLQGFSLTEKQLASKAFDHLASQRGVKMAYTAAALAETVRESEAALSKVLDKLAAVRILRTQQRGEATWYELYHDMFSGSIESWNGEWKDRMRRRKFAQVAAASFVSIAALFVGWDYYVNATNYQLRISPKQGISDQVELWQGKSESFDLFHQQHYLAETDFKRHELEPDKQFNQKPVADYDGLQTELTGSLPINQRIITYADKGDFTEALKLAKKSIIPQNIELAKRVLPHLADMTVPDAARMIYSILKDSSSPAIKQRIVGADEFSPMIDRDTGVANPSVGVVLVHDVSEIKAGIPYEQTMFWVSQLSMQVVNQTARKQLMVLGDVRSTPVRTTVINALGNTPDVSEVSPFLLGLLIDSSVAEVLGQLQAKDAIPALLGLLRGDGGRFFDHLFVVDALVALQAKDAIPVLLGLLKDGDAHVLRYTAADALGKMQVKDAIPDLLSLLKNEDRIVRRSAADALGALQAKDAISALLNLLKDIDDDVRASAARALAQLQTENTIPVLLDKEDLRHADIEAAVQLQAKDAIPALLNLIETNHVGEQVVRVEVIRAFERFQTKDNIAILMKSLKSEFGLARAMVIQALAQLQAKDAIPALLGLLNDEDGNVRRSAIEALGVLQAKDAVPVLLGLLKDESRDVRHFTAEALGALQSKDVIPALLSLLKDRNNNVRSSAAQALAKLGEHPMIPNLFAVMSEGSGYSDNKLPNLELSSRIASGELLDFLLRRLKNGDPGIRQSATIAALRMERGNNLNEVPKRLLRRAMSLIDQRTRDVATKQLTDEDKQESEEKARQHPVNQPGLEAKPLSLDELKTKLDGLDQAYADWRERRDTEPTSSTSTDPKATDSETNKLADPAPFIYEYAYAIANMDEAEGIKLLGHNLAKVREAAARGLANSDFLGVPLLQKLEQEWLATDNPITRQGLFHAIDIALLAMEGIGADKELEALKAYEPTLTNERSAASIKPRVEWTRIQLQWRVDALKELKELADRQLPGLLKEYCLNPDGTDIEGCTIER